MAAEVGYFLEQYGSPEVEAKWLAAVGRGDFWPIDLTSTDYARMAGLVATYADFPLGTTDASIVLPQAAGLIAVRPSRDARRRVTQKCGNAQLGVPMTGLDASRPPSAWPQCVLGPRECGVYAGQRAARSLLRHLTDVATPKRASDLQECTVRGSFVWPDRGQEPQEIPLSPVRRTADSVGTDQCRRHGSEPESADRSANRRGRTRRPGRTGSLSGTRRPSWHAPPGNGPPNWRSASEVTARPRQIRQFRLGRASAPDPYTADQCMSRSARRAR